MHSSSMGNWLIYTSEVRVPGLCGICSPGIERRLTLLANFCLQVHGDSYCRRTRIYQHYHLQRLLVSTTIRS